MALLHLMHGFCTLHGVRLRAVTVDHGLRPESAREAETVRGYCATLGIPHDTLLWDEWDGLGNLQDAARTARYQRMSRWAGTHGIDTVALGHTADDQAETLLMHLARQSGVNGLSGMPSRKVREGLMWVRPLLGAGREELRAYLNSQGIAWIEDPSNENAAFRRVTARAVLAALAPLGIDAKGLAAVAANMSEARKALDWQTFLAARDLVTVQAGAVVLCENKMRILPSEIQRRLLVHAVGWISGAAYPPRRAAIANLMTALRKGQSGTLDGCHARRVQGKVWVFRELNAVRDVTAKLDTLWDYRWRLSPEDPDGNWQDVTVRALGPDGLEQCPDWRKSGLPHEVLLSTPAVWRGDTVIAAPLAETDQKWHARVDGGEDAFFAALLSH